MVAPGSDYDIAQLYYARNIDAKIELLSVYCYRDLVWTKFQLLLAYPG